MWYKQFSYLNYGSISPTYVPPEAQQDDINLETSEIPVVDGGYILELSYECAVETNWQLGDDRHGNYFMFPDGIKLFCENRKF